MAVILEFDQHYKLRESVGKLKNIKTIEKLDNKGKPYYILYYCDTGKVASVSKYPASEWDLDRYIRSGFANILDAPIKAQTPKDREKVENMLKSDDWWLQHKLDGVRARCYIGKYANRFFGGSIIKSGFYAEYTDNIPHLRDLDLSKFEGTLLDGELIHPSGEVPDSKTPGVLNSLPQTAWNTQAVDEFLMYIVYDITHYRGIDIRNLPYSERLKFMYKVLYGNNGNIWHESFLPIITVQNRITIEGTYFSKRDYLDYVFNHGYEGCILKNKDAPYEHKKTKNLIKVKLEKTYDVIITGFSEPKKYYIDPSTGKEDTNRLNKYYEQGLIGTVNYGVIAEGKEEINRLLRNGGTRVKKLSKNKMLIEIGKCSGMTDSVRVKFTKSKKDYLYQVMEIKANGIIDERKGTLRHPRFIRMRKDKSMHECTYKEHIKVG